MKKFYLFSLALAMMFLPSCNKEGGVERSRPIEVSVSIRSGDSTKASGIVYENDEGKVNNLQVFVFADGKKDAYKSVSGALSVTVPATSGEREVWAVVNARDLSTVATLDDLKKTVSALVDNSRGNFVMAGSVKMELTDGGIVPIVVRRLAARVSVAKISTKFPAGSFRENFSVKINSLYLINVAANNSFDLKAGPSLWVNKLRHSDTDHDALLYESLNSIVVKNGTPYEKVHVFYPYPNPYGTNATNNFDDAWSPRGSLLVLDVTMYEADGTTVYANGYYPIPLPALERNKMYIIEEVEITRVPGSDPYKPIETGESQVTVTVQDWEEGLSLGTVTI